MAIVITTTDKTVTVNGKTQGKGGFTIQDAGDGYVNFKVLDSGVNLRSKLEDVSIDGTVPTDYDDLKSLSEALFSVGGGDGSTGVASVSGTLVNNTDPANPVIGLPTWGQVSGKPTTFAPSAHTHPFTEITGTAVAGQIPTLAISKISGLQGALDDKLDAADALEIGTTATTAKAGNYQPTWAQVTGKPTEFPPSSHTHPFSEVTGTATVAQIPTLAISKISGLQGELDGKLTGVQGAAVADAVDETDVVAQFNALLASLRTAGVIAV